MRTKILSLTLALVMVFACSMSALAAEPTDTVEEMQEISVVFENSGGIETYQVGDSILIPVGGSGSISNCGIHPTFKIWVTGGSASTQVKIDLVGPAGESYGPFGPINADGSNYLEKKTATLLFSGSWTFKPYVSNGGSAAGLVCHVQQTN